MQGSGREFCFGSTSSQKILGVVLIHISRRNLGPGKGTKTAKVEIDVGIAPIPMLVSHESLQLMQSVIDSQRLQWAIREEWVFPLTQTPSVHIMLNGGKTSVSNESAQIYAAEKTEITPRLSTYKELRRIRISLGHCSLGPMTSLLGVANTQVGHSELHELYLKCGCANKVHRISPPQVS